MSVKLAGKLPDREYSGLDQLQGPLVRKPESRHIVIAVIDCVSTKVDHAPDGDIHTPTAGVLFIEPIKDAEDVNTLVEIMGRVRAERLNDGTLDFDFGVGDPLADAMKTLHDSGATVSFLKHGSGVHVGGEG